MEIWYTSRKKFTVNEEAWSGYVQWSNFNQVSEELITLDTNLCDPIIEIDLEDEESYKVAALSENSYFTYCYKNLDFVLSNTVNLSECNILAVAYNPLKECSGYPINNFVFIGYDLMDQSNDTSSLTNCGGFEDVFNNNLLNKHGLINDFATASKINTLLIETHPEEYHADTNIWAVWKMNDEDNSLLCRASR